MNFEIGQALVGRKIPYNEPITLSFNSSEISSGKLLKYLDVLKTRMPSQNDYRAGDVWQNVGDDSAVFISRNAELMFTDQEGRHNQVEGSRLMRDPKNYVLVHRRSKCSKD